MDTKHTPGPWKYSSWEQFGDTRFYVSQKEGAPYTPNYSDVASLISETVSGERVAIQEANARLIAAAPELLAALHDCLAFLENDCPLDLPCAPEIRAARAAIAKATGAAE